MLLPCFSTRWTAPVCPPWHWRTSLFLASAGRCPFAGLRACHGSLFLRRCCHLPFAALSSSLWSLQCQPHCGRIDIVVGVEVGEDVQLGRGGQTGRASCALGSWRCGHACRLTWSMNPPPPPSPPCGFTPRSLPLPVGSHGVGNMRSHGWGIGEGTGEKEGAGGGRRVLAKRSGPAH